MLYCEVLRQTLRKRKYANPRLPVNRREGLELYDKTVQSKGCHPICTKTFSSFSRGSEALLTPHSIRLLFHLQTLLSSC